MKKTVLMVIMALVLSGAGIFADVSVAGHELSPGGTYAAASGSGLGIIFGDTNALVLKSWINSVDAMQYDLEYNVVGKYSGIGIAFLKHDFDIIKSEDNKFPIYLGIKGYVGLYNGKDGCAGVEVPIGIDWILKDTPIDISFDVDPGFQIVNPSGASRFAWGDGFGFRYWFR
jgi:hypothetical protein